MALYCWFVCHIFRLVCSLIQIKKKKKKKRKERQKFLNNFSCYFEDLVAVIMNCKRENKKEAIYLKHQQKQLILLLLLQ